MERRTRAPVSTIVHPNNLIGAMASAGYTLADMAPAYPGRDETYIDQVLRDNALALSRPVIAYGLLGIHPCRSRYFNIADAGFRSNGDAQPWPPAREPTSVYFFGGSTALGYNVEDRDTLSAALQRHMAGRGIDSAVYNFGSGNYTSRHALLRFIDIVDSGITPDVAVFLNGFNDCFYAYGNRQLIDALDALFQKEKARRRMSLIPRLIDHVRAAGRGRDADLPTGIRYSVEDNDETRFFTDDAAIERALSSRPGHKRFDFPDGPAAAFARHAWRQYLDSVAMTRAMAAAHKIRTVFVWQPVPLFATLPEQRIMDRLFSIFRSAALCAPVYDWLEHTEFPGMGGAGDFLDLSRAGEGLGGVLYLDLCHYTGRFNDALAARIAEFLFAKGLVGGRPTGQVK